MRNKKTILMSMLFLALNATAADKLTSHVNPFMGTATLWEPADLGYTRTETKRAWGAEVFPGATLPNAMVQLTPVTMYRSGSGYQYEDRQIYGFAHTSKGHWNLLHLSMLPATGRFYPDNFCSFFTHERESASPGYYQVFLERYNVNAELTSTLRCGYHRYTYTKDGDKKLIVDITRSNNNPRRWEIEKSGERSFEGYQDGEGRIYFHVETSHKVESVDIRRDHRHTIAVVSFVDDGSDNTLELKVGCSFVSIENAKENLANEIGEASFDEIRSKADATWEDLLSHIEVSGGSDRDRDMFYTTLYRSFMWPALRSDCNGEYVDARRDVQRADFRYYTDPSFWDTYRNDLILIGMITPDVACDIVKSICDRGNKTGGYMPIFFHGDHASAFVSGLWTRGIRDYDVDLAYQLMLKNATVAGRRGRPFIDEYMRQGWIAEKDTTNVPTWDEYKASVTKTVEYAYDDYAVAQIAKALGDKENYKLMMKRSQNYKNLFDPSTGFWRGKTANGEWIKDFDPYYPYYAYMYREANAWQSLFFAPHDPAGMVALYPSYDAVEQKLDSLFSEPWRGYEAWNLTGFLGNYCHGNQPDHNVPFTYYFIGKQEKSQAVLNKLMRDYYGMGREGLAYAGMDDSGEMSAWFVLNAIGIYTYSPADPEYIVSVPLFRNIKFTLGGTGKTFTIRHEGDGLRIKRITVGGKQLKGYFVGHQQLAEAGNMTIETE